MRNIPAKLPASIQKQIIETIQPEALQAIDDQGESIKRIKAALRNAEAVEADLWHRALGNILTRIN